MSGWSTLHLFKKKPHRPWLRFHLGNRWRERGHRPRSWPAICPLFWWRNRENYWLTSKIHGISHYYPWFWEYPPTILWWFPPFSGGETSVIFWQMGNSSIQASKNAGKTYGKPISPMFKSLKKIRGSQQEMSGQHMFNPSFLGTSCKR